MFKRALSFVSIVLACGCQSPVAPETGPGREWIVAVDTSGSARAKLARFGDLVCELAENLGPRDRIRAIRFGHQAHTFYHSGRPANDEEFKDLVASQLLPEEASRGTLPRVLFETIAGVIEREVGGRNVIVVVLTDGGNDDGTANGSRLYGRALGRIQKEGRVQAIAFMGVDTGLREKVEARFAQFGSRFAIVEDLSGLRDHVARVEK